ncbi:MAG TPA: hypothetical protein VIL07_00710 [Symbiobacteriaceae bacterium]
MSIWQLTDADVEAVATQIKQGRSYEEIARDLDISVEMVVCAARKWPEVRQRMGLWADLF